MPLLALGISDRLAGRVILVLFGAAYVVAVNRFSATIWRTDARFIRGGISAAAVLQATLWSTYLLDPDLIAAFFLFVYLTLTAGSVPARSFGAGVAAGFAFLSKAYLLPFVVVHLIANLAFRRISLRAVACALAGLLMVTAPWIGTLSRHYLSFTISSAGSSNHANLAPGVYGKDLLWKPGLVADYIIDPKLGPDWSPLQDGTHFQHQLALLLKLSGFRLCHGRLAFVCGCFTVYLFGAKTARKWKPACPRSIASTLVECDQTGLHWWIPAGASPAALSRARPRPVMLCNRTQFPVLLGRTLETRCPRCYHRDLPLCPAGRVPPLAGRCGSSSIRFPSAFSRSRHENLADGRVVYPDGM